MIRFNRSSLILTGLALIALMFAAGCETTPRTQKKTAATSGQYSFWPQFPAEPRMQFLVNYRYSTDISPAKTGFENLIYGKDSGVLPIIKPYGVEMWHGAIYVCDIRNPGVVVLDIAKKQTRIMTTRGLGGMAQPTDIAIADDGMKYVADAIRGIVFVFDQNERHVNTFGHENFKPVGVAVSGDRLYVCDFATQKVFVLNRHDGSTISTIGGPGGEDGKFVRPLGIDVDSEGNIWVSDVIKCRLQKFDPDGNLLMATGQISDTAGSFVRPKHVSVDKASDVVFIPDAAFDNVQMFDDQGRILMFFGSGGRHEGAMDLPAGICTNSEDIELFRQYIHPDFVPETLVLVTNQFGRNKVAVYAMGHLREGVSVQDIQSTMADVSPGVREEGELNPTSTETPITPSGNGNEPDEPQGDNPDSSGGG